MTLSQCELLLVNRWADPDTLLDKTSWLDMYKCCVPFPLGCSNETSSGGPRGILALLLRTVLQEAGAATANAAAAAVAAAVEIAPPGPPRSALLPLITSGIRHKHLSIILLGYANQPSGPGLAACQYSLTRSLPTPGTCCVHIGLV